MFQPMNQNEKDIYSELALWQKEMLSNPSLLNRISKHLQTRINKWIPEKVHLAITSTLKQMIRAVLFGATHTTAKPLSEKSIELAFSSDVHRKGIFFVEVSIHLNGFCMIVMTQAGIS